MTTTEIRPAGGVSEAGTLAVPPRGPAGTVLRSELALADPAAQFPRPLTARTRDDVLNAVGAGVASLALVWLIYDRLLPLTGTLGFVVSWYVMFVLVYAAITTVTNPGPALRDRVASSLIHGGSAVVGGALASVVLYTFISGLPALHHVNFYIHDEAGIGPLTPLDRGGCLHAVVGSLIEIGIAVAITLPLGVGTAVFMSEVGGRGSKAVRTIVEAMTALPSIVAGLFIYTLLLRDLGFHRNGIAASLALAVMMLPIIARAADVVLRVVPGGLREASLALGASTWQTVWRVVLPTARPGLTTALILGIARGVGETSPVLLTSGASTYLTVNPFKEPMNSLPLFIFSHVRSGQTLYIERGYGAASVLLAVVLLLFIAARLIARQRGGTR